MDTVAARVQAPAIAVEDHSEILRRDGHVLVRRGIQRPVQPTEMRGVDQVPQVLGLKAQSRVVRPRRELGEPLGDGADHRRARLGPLVAGQHLCERIRMHSSGGRLGWATGFDFEYARLQYIQILRLCKERRQ